MYIYVYRHIHTHVYIFKNKNWCIAWPFIECQTSKDNYAVEVHHVDIFSYIAIACVHICLSSTICKNFFF